MTTTTDIFPALLQPPVTREEAREALKLPAITAINYPSQKQIDEAYDEAIRRRSWNIEYSHRKNDLERIRKLETVEELAQNRINVHIRGNLNYGNGKNLTEALESFNHRIKYRDFGAKTVAIDKVEPGYYEVKFDERVLALIMKQNVLYTSKCYRIIKKVHPGLQSKYSPSYWDVKYHGFRIPEHDSSLLEFDESFNEYELLTIQAAKKKILDAAKKSEMLKLIDHLRHTGPMTSWCEFFPYE